MFRDCGRVMVGSKGMVMGEEWVAQCKEGTCEGDCSCKWERSKVARQCKWGESCDVFVHGK